MTLSELPPLQGEHCQYGNSGGRGSIPSSCRLEAGHVGGHERFPAALAKFGTPPYAFRAAEHGDRGYIIDTWLQTYRPHWLRAYGGPSYMRQLESVYWSQFGHVGLVEHLVNTANFVVMTLPEHGPWMYGWLCYDPGPPVLPAPPMVVHYAFVREEFRGQKLGRALLDTLGIARGPFTVTHMTPDFSRGLARERDVRFVNPYRKAER